MTFLRAERRFARPPRWPSALGMLLALVTLLWVTTAHAAFTPPPINGHVMDTAGVLTPEQVLQLDAKLDRARQTTGFALVVFVAKSLEGESIDDVAYTTFNTWKVGSAKGDDGVLLVLAPQERKIRIETGKGVGGGLTDIGSSHIIRDTIAPLMRQAQYFEAADRGTDAIVSELAAGTPGGTSDPGKKPGARSGHGGHRTGSQPTSGPMSVARMIAIVGGILLVLV